MDFTTGKKSGSVEIENQRVSFDYNYNPAKDARALITFNGVEACLWVSQHGAPSKTNRDSYYISHFDCDNKALFNSIMNVLMFSFFHSSCEEFRIGESRSSLIHLKEWMLEHNVNFSRDSLIIGGKLKPREEPKLNEFEQLIASAIF